MNTFLITLVVFGIALTGMAIGVIFGNRCIKGSCGGLGGLKDAQGNSVCDGCTNPSPTCSGPPEEHAETGSKLRQGSRIRMIEHHSR